MKEKVAVIGAGGNIGVYVLRGLESMGYNTVPAFHDYVPQSMTGATLDITDEKSVSEFFKAGKPDSAVLLSAIADPDACEKNMERSRQVNVTGAKNVAKVCDSRGAYLIHYSTDLVFDGKKGMYKEQDSVSPLSEYGKMKADSEKAVLGISEQFSVLRTAIVYGKGSGKRKNFFEATIENLKKGEPVNLFTDQVRSFMFVEDSATAVAGLIKDRLAGVYHAGGQERISRYDFMVEMMKLLQVPTDGILPVSMEDILGMAPRPKDCSLDSSKIAEHTGFSPTSMDEAAKRMANLFC